ncbi:hypothetical protein FRB99_007813 [Tulasnella sp. 403]|nr:hypothetical protein FRB99_007813 [Tulasnella sp. 403]
MPEAIVPSPVKENASQVKEEETEETTSPSKELTELQKFDTESYEGIIPALIRVPMEIRYDDSEEGQLHLFGRDCIMESKAWARQTEREEKRRQKEIEKKKGKRKKDGVKEEVDNYWNTMHERERETLPLTMYYISDAGAESGDVEKECTPIEDLFKGVKVCFHACKLSRSKPEGVDASKLAFVELNDTDIRGSFYFQGPPGQFWDLKAYPDEESDFIDAVHVEVVVCRFCSTLYDSREADYDGAISTGILTHFGTLCIE